MTESILIELLKQGGFALLAAVMFFIYRADAKTHAAQLAALAEENAKRQTETAAAWMQYGREQGAMMERVASTLERIEDRLHESTICPVAEVAREAPNGAGAGRRRDRVAQAVRAAMLGGEPEPA